jgi:RNA polymerase sigma-70 factor (ECF subfamily)
LAVHAALAQLDPEVRDVLDRTYFAGSTAREIAEQTGVALGTVKSRLARGLSLLEVVLSDSDARDQDS